MANCSKSPIKIWADDAELFRTVYGKDDQRPLQGVLNDISMCSKHSLLCFSSQECVRLSLPIKNNRREHVLNLISDEDLT